MTPDSVELHNPWREFIENCINGDNYFRASEYRDLLADLDRGYAAIAQVAALTRQPVAGDATYQCRARSDRSLGESGWMEIGAEGYMKHPGHFDYRVMYTTLAPDTPADGGEGKA